MTNDWSRRRVLKGMVAMGGVAAIPSLLGGCEQAGFANTLEKVKEKGVIKVGYSGERPYAYYSNGLVGAIPAVHRAVFDRIGGIELEGVKVPWRNLIEGLNSGVFDVISAGMYVTPTRCAQVGFAEPTYCIPEALMVRKDNPLGLSNYDSIAANKKATVAVIAATVEQRYALAAGVPEDRVVLITTQEQGLELVADGDVDAFGLTSISLRTTLEHARQAESSGPVEGPADWAARVELTEPFVPVINGDQQLGCGAAGFRLTDDLLVAAFNEALAALHAEGKVLELMKPYGFRETNMPGPELTSEQLCRGEVRALSGTKLLPR